MIITASEIRNDTYHFFGTQIKKIFFICMFVTCISILIDMFIQPNVRIISIIENNKLINTHSFLDLVKNMNIIEKNQLLKYFIFKIIELLLSKTLLLGIMLTLIFNVSSNKGEPMISLISSFFPFLPNLFILNFLITFLIQLGFMFFIIPGVLLSIMLSLSPIIFSFKKHSIIESMQISMSISWQHIKIIGSGVILWMCSKFFVTTILSSTYFLNKNIIFLILNMSLNILYSLLIIYLFRFYMIFLRSQKLNIF
ncbi:hypothetical protein ATN01_01370 [Buchnera aphidicola (Diuraphis noxia)]|uniref:UPF0259 membrane protein ATN01_01370 n=2 Tax=Buchnera aphidicola TaxID=9 RepID=A0A1B2H8F3_BUCDN|nr:YciC family protein [Buchnera aphidicola]ANZ22490.1 hypothetical protein ATN01_01370 [Buchnera aphidicola (Diuraphis noxia)]